MISSYKNGRLLFEIAISMIPFAHSMHCQKQKPNMAFNSILKIETVHFKQIESEVPVPSNYTMDIIYQEIEDPDDCNPDR